MRQFIAAGNWKMNKTYQEGLTLATTIANTEVPANVQVILGTPAIHLAGVHPIIAANPNVHVAAQNCHQETKGAYTGEISVSMIESTGATFVILGHSERREYFGESSTLVAQKVDLTLTQNLRPIYCCGESLDIREAGTHTNFVSQQIEEGLFHLSPEDFQKVVIAYEPIWAIGTGVTASPAQAQDMHAHIRSLVANKYGATIADNTSILYGGSVKPANAKELFAQTDIDGGLVGGASLKPDDFIAIINSFSA